MDAETRFPRTHTLHAAGFHPDWHEDCDSPDEVIADCLPPDGWDPALLTETQHILALDDDQIRARPERLSASASRGRAARGR